MHLPRPEPPARRTVRIPGESFLWARGRRSTMTMTLSDRLMRFLSHSRDELLGFVRGLSHSAEEAEDIVQEATARTLASGEHVRAPETYLFVVARNLARQQASPAVAKSWGDPADAAWVEGAAPSAEEEALTREQSDALRSAVARLPRQCRAAFALRIFHGCSYQEIADRMGLSVKTVQRHIDRGLHDTRLSMRSRFQTNPATGVRGHD